jgi:hypothetical protein
VAARSAFDLGDLLLRVGAALALVFATYNPTGWSYARWALDRPSGQLPWIALAGVTLLILWVIYVRATYRAMGALGIALAAAFFASAVWVLADMGVLALDAGDAAQWTALTGLGLVLGIGLSWSHVRRALSGQVDVDDVET